MQWDAFTEQIFRGLSLSAYFGWLRVCYFWFFTSGSPVQLNQHLTISWGWWRGRRISLHRSGGRMDVPKFRLWSIMFVAKAVGQAIINTHIATVAQQLFRVPVDDEYWYIRQLLSEYFEIQAPKMWLQGGSFGPNGWCWTKKARLRLFGGLKDVHIGPWWFKMLMMIAPFAVNSTC